MLAAVLLVLWEVAGGLQCGVGGWTVLGLSAGGQCWCYRRWRVDSGSAALAGGQCYRRVWTMLGLLARGQC